MSFLKRLGEISKPKIYEAKFDFQLGDGEETIWIRALNYAERGAIFGKRLQDTGMVKLDSALSGELLATCLCKEDGTTLVNLASVQKWPPDLVDKLGYFALEVIQKGKEEAAALDPPTG